MNSGLCCVEIPSFRKFRLISNTRSMPADGQPLEVELRRDPEVQIHVERVVMRDERPRQRAAGDRLHHRRLDLEVAARRHELADRGDDPAAGLEDAARVGVDDEVEVALPVADLDVGQAVPLLGQRQQALRQEVQPRRPDRELVGLGAEQPPFDADPVAEIEQLEDLEIELRQRVLPDVDLYLRRPSDSTRKFALPNDRIARMRPLVTVSTRSASSSSRLRGAVPPASCETVCRRSNACG